MPSFRRIGAACAVLIALGAAAPLAFAQMNPMARGQTGNPTFKPGPGPDELWETTMKMEASGFSMPEQTTQSCIKKGRGAEGFVPRDEECTTTDVRTTGNKTTFAMVCKGDPPMSGSGEITAGRDAYSGRITARSTRRGEDMTMTQTFSAKRVGTCTDLSEQMVAKAEADGKAMIAKTCAEGLETLEPTLFEGSNPCTAQRKQFCDKTAGVAGEMRDPPGHSAARRKYANTLQRALKSCNQDYAAISKVACGKAVDGRNWNFVGSGPCDDDVRAQAPKYCNTGPNRSPDPQYFALCSRYVALTRGTATAEDGGSAPAPTAASRAAPPAPAQPDPIKQGVDAVRRLLPF